MIREWLHHPEKPLQYYLSCLITGSVCFEHSSNLRVGHIYWVSAFCPKPPFRCKSCERVNFKWKNIFARSFLNTLSYRIHLYLATTKSKQRLCGGGRNRWDVSTEKDQWTLKTVSIEQNIRSAQSAHTSRQCKPLRPSPWNKHKFPPQTRPYAAAVLPDLLLCPCNSYASPHSFRKSNTGGLMKQNCSEGRTNERKTWRWTHLLRNKEHLRPWEQASPCYGAALWAVEELQSEEVILSHNSVLFPSSKQNPLKSAGAGVTAG